MCKNVHNYLHNVLEVLAFCIVGELPLLFPGAILVIYPSKFAFGAEPDATADQTVPSMRKSLSVRVWKRKYAIETFQMFLLQEFVSRTVAVGKRRNSLGFSKRKIFVL